MRQSESTRQVVHYGIDVLGSTNCQKSGIKANVKTVQRSNRVQHRFSVTNFCVRNQIGHCQTWLQYDERTPLE